jgi:hypothetical protein
MNLAYPNRSELAIVLSPSIEGTILNQPAPHSSQQQMAPFDSVARQYLQCLSGSLGCGGCSSALSTSHIDAVTVLRIVKAPCKALPDNYTADSTFCGPIGYAKFLPLPGQPPAAKQMLAGSPELLLLRACQGLHSTKI